MTILPLDVSPQDISSRALGIRLDGPRPRTLAQRNIRCAESSASLTLGILGASHVVDVALEPAHPGFQEQSCTTSSPWGEPRIREEISCEARDGGDPLADGTYKKEYENQLAYYRLRVQTLNHRTEEEFVAHARHILHEAGQESLAGDGLTSGRSTAPRTPSEAGHWLVGTFPGTGSFHITALWGTLSPLVARWATWHFYPQEHVVVTSESTLTRKALNE